MKAKDLKVGDEVDGWTVTVVEWTPSLKIATNDMRVLLTQECEHWDPNDLEADGEPFMVTRRVWFRSDEEVGL